MKRDNLVGCKFERLTVIRLDDDDPRREKNKRSFWTCKCDCGNYINVLTAALKNGNTRSCGCLKREINIENGKKNAKSNKYVFKNEYAIGYTEKGQEFYFDIDDIEVVSRYCWRKRKDGYLDAKTKEKNNPNKRILMHRLIFNRYGEEHIDHINGQRNDNRKSNLRISDVSGLNRNNMNKCKLKNNTSGITGVKWHKRDLVWECTIGFNNKSIYLGRFTDFNQAIETRRQAENKYFGEWSYHESRKEGV